MTDTSSPEKISPLRLRMLEDMRILRLGQACRSQYVRAAKKFAAFLKRSPEKVSPEDVRRFQLQPQLWISDILHSDFGFAEGVCHQT